MATSSCLAVKRLRNKGGDSVTIAMQVSRAPPPSTPFTLQYAEFFLVQLGDAACLSSAEAKVRYNFEQAMSRRIIIFATLQHEPFGSFGDNDSQFWVELYVFNIFLFEFLLLLLLAVLLLLSLPSQNPQTNLGKQQELLIWSSKFS